MRKVVNAEEISETAVERMWKATSAFAHSLDAYPGWREFQKTRMHRAMDFDDLGLSPDRTPEMFEFPIEITRQHDVVTLYLELMDNVLSVKSCEYYLRRYPFRGVKRFFANAAGAAALESPELGASFGRASTHWLRHTFGSHGLATGMALESVRIFMGTRRSRLPGNRRALRRLA